MPDLLTRGGVDGCGAVVGREVIFRWESVDRLYFGQDPPRDDWPDAIQLGEPGPGAVDQGSDLRPDRGHLRVQRPNIVQVLMGQLAAHHIDRINGTQLGQQLLGSRRPKPTMGPARSELAQQTMQPAHRLRAQRAQLVAAIAQQPQADQRVITAHHRDACAVQRSQTDRDRVIGVGLAAMPLRVHPNASGQFRGHVEHDLAVTGQPLRQRPARAMATLHRPAPMRPAAGELP